MIYRLRQLANDTYVTEINIQMRLTVDWPGVKVRSKSFDIWIFKGQRSFILLSSININVGNYRNTKKNQGKMLKIIPFILCEMQIHVSRYGVLKTKEGENMGKDG